MIFLYNIHEASNKSDVSFFILGEILKKIFTILQKIISLFKRFRKK